MPLWGCATATLSIFTARIGLTIDAGSVGKPSNGHVGGGGGAVVVVAGGVVVVDGLVVVVGALFALPPPPHAVTANRHATARAIQRSVLRGNVSCPLCATTAATRPLWRGAAGRGGMPDPHGAMQGWGRGRRAVAVHSWRPTAAELGPGD